MPTADHEVDPRFIAGVDLLARTGSASFTLRHSPDDDGDPIVWTAIVEYHVMYGIARKKMWQVAAGLDPVSAVMKLCETVIDGGTCAHCGTMTTFSADLDNTILELASCVYAWDPELKTFRRGCEGD